jgi:hypothetical protein
MAAAVVGTTTLFFGVIGLPKYGITNNKILHVLQVQLYIFQGLHHHL